MYASQGQDSNLTFLKQDIQTDVLQEPSQYQCLLRLHDVSATP